MHPPVPFAGQHGSGSNISCHPAGIHRAFAGGLRRYSTVEKATALAVQITEVIGLKPIGQQTEEDMSGQVRGLSLEDVLPTGTKRSNVEIAQMRDLDVERLSIRRCRTDFHTGHVRQATARRLD